MKKELVKVEFLKTNIRGSWKTGDVEKVKLEDALLWKKEGVLKILDEKKITTKILKKKSVKIIKKESTTLSDEQVYDKLKDIAKLKLPGEISKGLRKLERKSDYNIIELGNQINNIRKGIDKDSVDLVVTDVTNDTHDTLVTNEEIKECVTIVTRNTHLLTQVFEDSNLDEILKILVYSKQAITFGELALKTGKSEASVKNTISRNKEYFGSIKPKGRKSYVYLLRFGLDVLRLRIDKIKAKEEQKKQEEQEKEKNISEKEEVLISIKNFLEFHKKKVLQEIKGGKSSVKIDFIDLTEFSVELSNLLIEDPEETIRLMEIALEETGLVNNVRVRIKNIPKSHSINIEDFRSKNINELIFVEGRIISVSDVRPQVVNARFECPSCGSILSVLQLEKKFREPNRCSCGRRGGFKLISEDMVDTARIILEDLQEKTDNPHSSRLNCFLKEDLLNGENIKILSPGNEVKVIGVLKKVPVPIRSGGLSTRFDLAFEVNNIELCESEVDIKNFTEEEVESIISLSMKIDEKGLKEINSSFAPHVFGYDEIKSALVLQLCSKKNETNNDKPRNKPNILLVGDPGTAKSELGKFSIKITPGSRIATGGGSSAVGITASVIREEGEGYRVEPGAMVIAKELLFLDELNNLTDEDKPKLQEGMSEQKITINKANVHMTLKVTAGILAAANPVSGTFRLEEPLEKQYNLPAPIINRFDLIFSIRDQVSQEEDKSIAKRMINRDRGLIKTKYSEDLLKKFFVYVRNLEEPVIDNKMSERLQELYSQLRIYKRDNININPRIHEAVLRLLKSSAKIRMSKRVEEKDVERGIEILSKSYYQIPGYENFKPTTK